MDLANATPSPAALTSARVKPMLLVYATSALSELSVVFDSLAVDHGSKGFDWSGGNQGGSLSSGYESASLATGLVEPVGNVSLPVFPQVDVGDDVVVFYHCL